MNHNLHKKSILKNTFKVGGLTFLSRCLGIVREMLTARFLGVGIVSDAFITAFKIPNFLRKIFAEGALSAAFIPTFIKTSKEDKNQANSLMSVAFLFFEALVLIFCITVFLFAGSIIKLIAPGFSSDQLISAAVFLKILFPFILFISASALIAAALQSVNKFEIPALSSSILNIFWIISVFLALSFYGSPNWLCLGIILGGAFLFLAHLIQYFKAGFSFGIITKETIDKFKPVIKKFFNCFLGVGIVEVNLFIDTTIASFLPIGSVSLLYYGTRFSQIPVAVFAIAFSTILLPQFSRVALYAPSRIQYYLLESIKFISFVILPVTIFLIFISEKLFSVLLFGKEVLPEQIWQAGWILTIMATGLIFFSLNKIVSNIFYSLHDTFTPTILGGISAIVNTIGNLISLWYLGKYAPFGIAASTVFASAVITIFSFIILKTKYKFSFYAEDLAIFFIRYLPQLVMSAVLFWLLYENLMQLIQKNPFLHEFILNEWGYWFFILPIGFMVGTFLFFTKKIFRVKLYFLKR